MFQVNYSFLIEKQFINLARLLMLKVVLRIRYRVNYLAEPSFSNIEFVKFQKKVVGYKFPLNGM